MILIVLLCSLSTGGDSHTVHRVDMYSATTEDLVHILDPAPGTDEGGGRRQHAVGAGEACWHSKTGPKNVKGPGDSLVGHFRNFSYGCKTEGSDRSLNRMGWCMVEYGLDDKQDDAAATGDYVLRKVYRSSRAKGKSSFSRKSATSTSAYALPTSGSKRKAAGDHAEARPTKLSLDQVKETLLSHDALMPVQVQHGADQGIYGYEGCQFKVEQQGTQQPRTKTLQNGDTDVCASLDAGVDGRIWICLTTTTAHRMLWFSKWYTIMVQYHSVDLLQNPCHGRRGQCLLITDVKGAKQAHGAWFGCAGAICYACFILC